MATTDEDLFLLFQEIGIEHTTHTHKPTFTVEEGRELKQSMPGGHTKNLFMKDKSGQLVLIAAEANHKLKLNKVHRKIGTGRLSFASVELMQQYLGVIPGSVTAFALMNDPGHVVTFYLDKALLDFDPINFHPLRNDKTTAVSLTDFESFLQHLGRPMNIIDFDALEDEA